MLGNPAAISQMSPLNFGLHLIYKDDHINLTFLTLLSMQNDPPNDSGIFTVPEIHVHFGRGHVLWTYFMMYCALTFIALHFGCQWGLEVSKKERKK